MKSFSLLTARLISTHCRLAAGPPYTIRVLSVHRQPWVSSPLRDSLLPASSAFMMSWCLLT